MTTERHPSVLSGAAWWRDRLFVWAMFPACFLLVGSYVAWRALTCLVDSWGDLRAGRVPAAVTVWGKGR